MAGLESTATKRRASLTPVKAYLVAYNIVSTLGWGYVLILTLIHVFNLDGKSDILSTPAGRTATSLLTDMFFTSSSKVESRLPLFLKPIYHRSMTTFSRIGLQTAFVQTFAILEVVHVLLGWVKSPLSTTVMQVSSRLFLVWGVTEQFPEVRSNPLYTSMVLAWSITEVIRYSFYSFNLLGKNPYPLLWLRYTTFFVLYPIGASSEAFVNYASLPKSSPLPLFLQGSWKLSDSIRGLLFVIWWPGLYVMYTHMMAQRRRVLIPGKNLKKD